jgi:streptogramin lyase
MPRRTRSQLFHLGLVAALIAGCGPNPGASPTTRKTAAPTAAPVVTPPSPGTTTVTALPTPAVGGGGIIANNGANLVGKVLVPAGIVSDQGGAIITNNGGNIIANNSGGVISDHGGARRLLEARPQLPYVGATVRVLDAAGQPVLGADGKPITATTDAQGAYAITALLPARNLLIDVQLPEAKGSVQAVVPRDGSGRKTVDVDLVSTLTTGYILEQYVKTQQDPLATLEKLPADVEKDTRAKAAAAVAASNVAPTALHAADVVKAVDDLRKANASFDAQMETVKKLLIVAGASDLGSGLKALDVTIGDISDFRMAKDGSIYILNTQDNRIWRLRPDRILDVAAGNRGTPDKADLAGKLPTEANLDRPVALALDPDDRLVFTDTHGTYRIGADGKLARVTDLLAVATAAGKDGEAVIATLEEAVVDPAWEADNGPYPTGPNAPKMYAFYRIKPGAAPEKLLTQLQDPDGEFMVTIQLGGIAWDGGNVCYFNVNNNGTGKAELWRYDLASKTKTVETPGAQLWFDGLHLVYVDAAGAYHAKPLFGTGATIDVPTPPQWAFHLGVGPDNKPYAVKFASVYRLDPGGPVRVAGVESGNSSAGGDASVFTFEVLSDSTVDPSGNVFALDTGKGGIFKVDTTRQIAKFGSPGGGNVQQLKADRQGKLYMSDGDGAKIGSFDANGTWTARYSLNSLICGFAMLPDGTGYATNWDTKDRHPRIWRLADGKATEIYDALENANTPMIALDAKGTLWAAGGGKLRSWDGSAWKDVKSDARFAFKGVIGRGGNMAIDAKGRCYFADQDLPTIFRYDPATDKFEDLAGPGTRHFAGNGTDDSIKAPKTPSFDAAGNLYFSDTGNRQVKRIAANEL